MSKVKSILGFILIVVLILVGAIFALLNEATVSLDLLFVVTPPVSVSLLVFAAFAIGLLVGMMISGLTVLKVKMQSRRRGSMDGSAALTKA